MSNRAVPVVALLGLLCVPVALNSAPPAAADDMATAASAFLGGLTPDQRTRATFDFEDQQRLDFHFIPRARKGLPFKEMTEPQREQARALLRAGLSQRGYTAATSIMELERVLGALEGRPDRRDPEMYFVSVFGTPAATAPWGWRVEGHHLSLNFTIVGDQPVAWAPSFFGTNPAIVREGPQKGTQILRDEEVKARALVTALTAEQRAKAIYETTAPRDIITGAEKTVAALPNAGITFEELTSSQRRLLEELLDVYLGRVAPDLGKSRFDRLQKAGMDTITFAWAGTTEVGGPHYYRIQGPTFLVEYDNTQNDANHIHSIWRDFNGDFGRDLLREHYRDVAHH